MIKYILPCLLAITLLNASDYCFVHNENQPWHIDASYRAVGSAEFKHNSSDLRYTDAATSIYYSHSLNPQNILSWQVGYSYFKLGWDHNPRFSQQNFHIGIASLALISMSFDRWRWLVNVGGTVSTETFDFAKTGVGYGLFCGRYCFSQSLGIHVGYIAYGGMHQFYSLPIAGIDWAINEKWKLTAIYPLDASLEYTFYKCWSVAAVYTSFGGPYRYPTRAQGGHGRFHDAIFEVYSTGAELDLNYTVGKSFWAGVGAGWNFGGWILIKDERGRHGKYYKFDSAPYAQGNLGWSF